MSRFKGLVPPVITPMHPDGSLDLEGIDRVVDHLIDGGMHGLFILGSSGQVAYLTDAERDAVVTRVVERVAGRVPVQVGAPDFTARRVAEVAWHAQDLGADAVVVSAPVYALNNAAETEQHLRMIAEAVDVPVFAYDVPVRVHSKLGLEMLIRLGQDGVLAGVKDSSGDDVAFRRLVAANAKAGHPLELLTGHEVMVDGMLLLGADGAVPGLANVDPAGYRRLWDAAQAGDWATARAEQDRLAQLFEIAFVPQGMSGDAGGIGAFKAAMASLGVMESGAMPAPLQPLSAADVARIDEILAEVGLLG
ncbi:4-hydroxy-tetrahydrodipicolinate synthase [Tessaracoccus bendigoensis DSM 12906]|uniref:4-hydroxy-tetrahydrodipicolinate synthase n=1 Tax=Tessaracoccus bendigoensis DSM 12906 TaxID=1123357 RepID=A0A1M6JW54_9ACTN|nr:dihydrodipicolinate synthase family protein [Tessaracoccus bendigoensis]SHJ50931.1 4-hydroxy-tetrahydrodipicolinate synthase [Tessaracoccus bendigoensis DSM 12906]